MAAWCAEYEPVDMDEVDPAFSFAGNWRKLKGGRQQLDKLIGVATRHMDTEASLARALHRGIGVHHSGLPLKYRQVVEILFRCGYLRVVIATGDPQQRFAVPMHFVVCWLFCTHAGAVREHGMHACTHFPNVTRSSTQFRPLLPLP